MSTLEIKSAGPPPELYADRMVAIMLRQLAEQRATLWDTLNDVALRSSDGSPKAQQKLVKRLANAGALYPQLTPGKRGRYRIAFFNIIGFNPVRDELILPGCEVPEKPWLLVCGCVLSSKGHGDGKVHSVSRPACFVTHHVLSRAAQRFGARTPKDLISTASLMIAAVDELLEKDGLHGALDKCPPHGYQVQIEKLNLTVVLTKHRSKDVFVALTIY